MRHGVDHVDQALIRRRRWHRHTWCTVRQEIIAKDREICDGSVDHRRKGTLAVFRNDDVASPRACFSIMSALNFADALVDREGHSVPRDDWIEDDVWVRELFIHAIQCFYELS